jgi:hypothetical protein
MERYQGGDVFGKGMSLRKSWNNKQGGRSGEYIGKQGIYGGF